MRQVFLLVIHFLNLALKFHFTEKKIKSKKSQRKIGKTRAIFNAYNTI